MEREADIFKFPRGTVLFIYQAQPCYAVLFAWAAAVVAECGGLTSYLAAIAREFGII
ncbi:hypothetical protein DSUL_30083 [Desulfovibrionales bacterium]